MQLENASAGVATMVGEPEKIERLWLLTISRFVLACKPSEPKQLRLGGFNFQVKLLQPVFQFLQKSFRFFTVLKANHKVIRIPEQVRFATALASKAALKPKVEHVMQVDVAQQRRNDSPYAKDNLTFERILKYR